MSAFDVKTKISSTLEVEQTEQYEIYIKKSVHDPFKNILLSSAFYSKKYILNIFQNDSSKKILL